jgi:hypothetical protein
VASLPTGGGAGLVVMEVAGGHFPWPSPRSADPGVGAMTPGFQGPPQALCVG